MTRSVIDRWHAFLDGGHDPAVLDELLADDVVFCSPAVFTPQEGKAKTVMYLNAAAKVFTDTDFHYVGEWFGDRSAVLEFAATVDGRYVNGVDMIDLERRRTHRVVQGDDPTVQGPSGRDREDGRAVAADLTYVQKLGGGDGPREVVALRSPRCRRVLVVEISNIRNDLDRSSAEAGLR